MFIWESKDWPNFYWNQAHLSTLLAETRYQQGVLLGRMKTLGFALQEEATLRMLTEDVVKTSEIEGEKLDPAQVRSSIARRLGLEVAGLVPADRNVEGIVELMLDATKNFDKPLTRDRLFGWHAALFPTGYGGMHKIKVGAWREDNAGPMQVVSGAIGREKVHYTAPPAERVPVEMERFIHWFNKNRNADPVLASGVAHLWLVTVHPFEDGNGRLARAIADMALARSERTSQRFYSMSSQIRKERTKYYDVLEQTQRNDLDITNWIEWFLGCYSRAVANSQKTLESTLYKARFWQKHAATNFNQRQQETLARLLDGFDGKLTSSKWAKINKCSQDTANRDIADLLEKGVLQKSDSKGRSTSYTLAETHPVSS